MRTMRDMLLALVNATLILAIVLVVSLIVLVGRVSDMRDSMVAMLVPQSDRISHLTAAVQRIDAKLEQCSSVDMASLREELQPLIANAPDLSALHGMTVRGLAEEIVDVAGDRLSAMTR